MKITFHGAAKEVTGSCYEVETEHAHFLVDCGMFQGGKAAAIRNQAPFKFNPRAIDFVILTHAHIDHCGLLPKLCRDGFKGPIYMTLATADLLDIMLRDSAHIQEYEAERALKRGRKKEIEITPAYRMADAIAVSSQVSAIEYNEMSEPALSIQFRLRDAGHILGSAIIELWAEDQGKKTKFVFSGDLGQPDRVILRDPTEIEDADILIVESTYGNRIHKNMEDTIEEFVSAVNETLLEKKGNVIIPAFALGRTQEIIYYFYELTRQGRFRDLNIFVDSPMATAVTKLTWRHLKLFDEEAKALAHWSADGDGVPNIKFTESVEESRALNKFASGAVIIAASGMCTAGRIKHHLKHNLDRRQSTILITGFQAAGTPGRKIVDRARTIRIHGKEIPLRADVYTLGGFSAHADQNALLSWLRAFKKAPQRTFVTHGEAETANYFAKQIRQQLKWHVDVPEAGEVKEIDINSDGASMEATSLQKS